MFLRLISYLLVGLLLFNDPNLAIVLAITTHLIYSIIFKSNDLFVFREWALLLYALNYLVSPSIIYMLPDEKVLYGMKISSEVYYSLAIPGYLLFALGLYIIPTPIFRLHISAINKGAILNKKLLIWVTLISMLFRVSSNLVPAEIGFVFYLISLLQFVSAFALLSINQKYWYWSAIVLILELGFAFIKGMYHDAIMWMIFYGIYFIYTLKPKVSFKLMSASLLVILVLFIQFIKSIYREEVWNGTRGATLSTAYEIGSENASYKKFFSEENLLGTLNRGNQAWIFASTVDNMDRTKNFQGMTNVNKYLEAAFLPRILAPDKIKSGNKEIFNEFSGHIINENTSMGLGIFADGYVAYGAWGVYIFGFTLGLVFALTFKLIERWSKISPFYVLLLLPLLNYAVRPDCELQTTINHLAKGIVLYGFLVYLTRKRFTLDSQENQRKLLHLNLAKSK